MDIVTPSLDQVLPKVDSRYTLVTLAAKRSRDMLGDKHPVTAERRSTRDVTNALEEIYEGQISYKRIKNNAK